MMQRLLSHWQSSGSEAKIFTFPENWKELSLDEKKQSRLHAWSSTAMEFASPDAETAYSQRTQMIRDVVNLKKPDRIPIVPWWGVFPAHHAGVTVQEATYDYDKLGMAWKKANADFLPDALISAALIRVWQGV